MGEHTEERTGERMGERTGERMGERTEEHDDQTSWYSFFHVTNDLSFLFYFKFDFL